MLLCMLCVPNPRKSSNQCEVNQFVHTSVESDGDGGKRMTPYCDVRGFQKRLNPRLSVAHQKRGL